MRCLLFFGRAVPFQKVKEGGFAGESELCWCGSKLSLWKDQRFWMCQPINHKSCVLLVTANHFPKLGVSMVMNSAGCTLDRNENKLNKSWELCDSSDPSGWGHLLSLSSSCKMVNICEFMIKKKQHSRFVSATNLYRGFHFKNRNYRMTLTTSFFG